MVVADGKFENDVSFQTTYGFFTFPDAMSDHRCYEAEQKREEREKHPINQREKHSLYPVCFQFHGIYSAFLYIVVDVTVVCKNNILSNKGMKMF